MTEQPLDAEDREVLRRRAQDRLAEAREWNATANPPLVARMSDRVQIDAGDLLSLLDALTRVGAQSETRRLDITYWRERAEAMEQRIRDLTQEARDERASCLDQMEQVRIRDARIKAVEDVLDAEEARPRAIGGGYDKRTTVRIADIRRALNGYTET